MLFNQFPEIPEIIIIQPEVFEDDRGYFLEMYHREKFEKAGIKGRFVQDNRAMSKHATLRGLHYQIRKPQGKLVWALSGEIFDVAVDIRKKSSTFGKWVGKTLSAENKIALYIPPDFAHGYCVMSPEAEVLYKCTNLYSPEYDRCIRWNDPDLAINWPIKNPFLSEKDSNSPFLKDAELPRKD